MNERIKELAEQAGLDIDDSLAIEPEPTYYGTQSDFEKFAELVRADEREACARECDDWPNGRDDVYSIGQAIRARGSDLQTAIERGTKAWADVPDATEWVEELRGNDTPEVTPEVPCKTDPRAPHGFNRNASFDEDRYVCDCEFWEPVEFSGALKPPLTCLETPDIVDLDKYVSVTYKSPFGASVYDVDGVKWLIENRGADYFTRDVKKVDISEECVHKTDKFIHEWVGLTDEEIMEGLSSFNEYGNLDGFSFAQWVENKLKEKNT